MKTVSSKELSRILDVTPRSIHRRGKEQNWQYKDTADGYQWVLESLPMDIQLKVASRGELRYIPEKASENTLYKEALETSRQVAQDRAALISLYEDSGHNAVMFCRLYNAGKVSGCLLEKLGKVSKASLYRWLKGFREDGIDGLVPKWGMTPGSQNNQLTEMEKGLLEHWFLAPEKRSMQHCWNQLRFSMPGTAASYKVVCSYLRSLPKPYVDYYRLGRTKFNALYQPYIDREPALYAPMEQVVSDHHCFDFVVRKNGKLVRPWITAFQDYRTGKLIGWCASVYPNTITISIAFYRLASAFGIPLMIHIDNGKDYRSHALNGKKKSMKVLDKNGQEEQVLVQLQGLFGMLDVKVTFSEPYHGQSKGRMERTFGSFAEYFSKNSGSYIGSNTVTRPEDSALFFRALNGKEKREDVPEWDEFIQAMEAFIPWWNANWRGQGKGLEGRTPDEVFASLESKARPADRESLIIALSKAEVRRVRENGITLDGVEYWAPELFEWSGRDVIVRRPLDNQEQVLVLDSKGKKLCVAHADFFVETGQLDQDITRVRDARKANMEALKEMGAGRIKPDENILEIASREYKETTPDQFPELPLAAGAESTGQKKTGSHPAPGHRKYISPLDI